MTLVRNQSAAFKKPLPGTPLNPTAPLSKGLLGAWLLNEGSGTRLNDSTGISVGALNAGGANIPIWDKTPFGDSIRITDRSQYVFLGNAARIFRTPINEDVTEFSIVHCFARLETSNEAAWAFGTRVTQQNLASSLAGNIPDADGNIRWQVGGTDLDSHVQIATQLDPQFDVWTFTNSRARGLEIWQNGLLRSFGKNKNPAWRSANVPLVLGDPFIESGSDAVGAQLGHHYFFFVYDRALSSEEIRKISHDPFSMYRTAFILYEPSGGGNIIATGGVAATGSAVLQDFVTGHGGIRGGGVGKPSSISKSIAFSGGITGSGHGIDLKAQIGVASGGARVSGYSVVALSGEVSGGATLSGSAGVVFFDESVENSGGGACSGTAINTIVASQVGTGGAIGNGSGLLSSIYITQGGAVLAGEADKHPGTTSVVGTGGAVIGGLWKMTGVQNFTPSSFAAVVGGRAINIRRGSIQNVHVGYALAMINTNKIQTTLEAKNAKVKIMEPSRVDATIEEQVERYESAAVWCESGDCVDNVLPKATINQQGVYLPPKNGAPTERNRGLATMTAI